MNTSNTNPGAAQRPRRILLVTHNDLDGAACAVLAKLQWPNSAKYHALLEEHDKVDLGTIESVLSGGPVDHGPELTIRHCHYDTLDNVAKAALEGLGEGGGFDELVFTDISPPNPLLEQTILSDPYYHGRVTILDHHKTAPWASVAGAVVAGGESGVKGAYDSAKCGARLLMEHLGLRSPAIARFVDIVEAWDLRQLESALRPAAEDYNRLYHFMGFDRWVDEWFGRLVLGSEDLNEHLLAEQDYALVPLLKERDQRYIEARAATATFGVDFDERGYVKVIASRCIGDLAEYLLERHDVDYAAVFMPEVGEHGQVSLRSLSDGADVGAIATGMGGGGHTHAADYTLPHPALRGNLVWP